MVNLSLTDTSISSLHDNNNNNDDGEFLKRQTEYKNVVNELIHTEKLLVDDMEAIYNGYMSVIEEGPNCPSTKICFDSIKGIIETGNYLLEKLGKSEKLPLDIANIFNELSASIKTHYGTYCSNYPSSTVELDCLHTNNEINEKLKRIQNSLNHLLPLESYLLKPVQRIMKYPLLLKSIVKLNLLGDEGQKELISTQKNMMKISEYINEKKREMEGVSLVDYYNSVIINLQEPLTVAKDGPVQLEYEFAKGNKKTMAILFSKILILTKPLSDGKLSFYKHFPLKDIILLENSSKSPTAFEISSYSKPKKKTTFEAKKIEIKDQWITHIKALILENLSLNFNDSKLSALLGEKVGSHVSTILSVKGDVAQAHLSCETLKHVFIDDEYSPNISSESGRNSRNVQSANPLNMELECKVSSSPRIRDVFESPKLRSVRCGPMTGQNEKELIEKASTAMNIFETISDFNTLNEPDEEKRKMYENIPWSGQLIRDAMIETEQILEQESDDNSSSITSPDKPNKKKSSLLTRSLINRKRFPIGLFRNKSKTLEQESDKPSSGRIKHASSELDKSPHVRENESTERKKTAALALAHQFESLDVDHYHAANAEKPIIGESLASRVQKLFEKTKTDDIVLTTKYRVTPKKAGLISERLMQLQEKTMVDIELARSPELKSIIVGGFVHLLNYSLVE